MSTTEMDLSKMKSQPKSSQLVRFKLSMEIDYERWRDGVGYDLEALREATPSERKEIEDVIITRSELDWRDIEALAEINTPRSRAAIKSAASKSNIETSIAAIRYARKLFTDGERISIIVDALRAAKLYGGLSQALDIVADFHPQEVVSELLRGVKQREGDVAVLYAAMLFYIYGKSKEPFDWEERPFLLSFNTEDSADRHEAYLELCGILNIQPDN